MLQFILGLVIGGGVVWLWFKNKEKPASGDAVDAEEKKQDIIEEQKEKQQENIKKIIEFLETRDKVANNDIEKLLGVSDATATRYLSELEKQGKLRQVGKEGHYTHYEKI